MRTCCEAREVREEERHWERGSSVWGIPEAEDSNIKKGCVQTLRTPSTVVPFSARVQGQNVKPGHVYCVLILV